MTYNGQGWVKSQTVGDPASGAGGVYQFDCVTAGLPANLIDPGVPITFRTQVTDHNGNIRIGQTN